MAPVNKMPTGAACFAQDPDKVGSARLQTLSSMNLW